MEQLFFYAFAGLTLLSALLVVTQNNPVRAVLFLVLAFISSAVLWILVEAEFLALILVLVYVGAVMTLFLFVVMMLNMNIEPRKISFLKYTMVSLVIIALLIGCLMMALPKASFTETIVSGNILSDTTSLGKVLYTMYLLPFELAAVLLLVAIMAAVTLTHRPPRSSKQQNVVQQMMTRRQDRITLVAMKSEH